MNPSPDLKWAAIDSPCPFYPSRPYGFNPKNVDASFQHRPVTVKEPELCRYMECTLADGENSLHFHDKDPDGQTRLQRGGTVSVTVSVKRTNR